MRLLSCALSLSLAHMAAVAADEPPTAIYPPSASAQKCKAKALFAEMSVAEPIPMDQPGLWSYYPTGTEDLVFVYHSSSACTQTEAAKQAKQNCGGAGGKRCVSLGGCSIKQGAAFARPADKSWGFLACGSTDKEAYESAMALCKLKTGCECVGRLFVAAGPGNSVDAFCKQR